MSRGVYIHIPFCKRICSYCAFSKVIYHTPWINKYLNALELEIKDRYQKDKIDTIYIGGGTPSSLSNVELNKLFEITNIFDKTNLKEFTFECNIEDISTDLLTILKNNKVNRLSIGIESFNKKNLKLMNRDDSLKSIKDKIKLIRSFGFNNINFDLIYALPNETIKVLMRDLKSIVKLKPEHISTYSLMIEDNTYLKYRNISNISEDIDKKMYDVICNYLKKKGYIHYEVSNFSKEGYSSIHNLLYWNNSEYYGFGLSSAGYIDGVRYNNTYSLSKYLNNNYRDKEELISKKGMMEYELILGLRKMNGISIHEFYNKYHVNIQDIFPIKELLLSKELILKDGYVFINPKYIYVMNEILLKLV